MTMTEQIQAMCRLYPDFQVVFNGGWVVAWEGPLRPYAQTYRIRVVAGEPRRVGDLLISGTAGANVIVLSPELELHSPHAPDEFTPHLYWNERAPTRSQLCLFDPATSEWEPGMHIAHTIIPWTIDWLASYEGWLATGEWTGGGRHPEIPS